MKHEISFTLLLLVFQNSIYLLSPPRKTSNSNYVKMPDFLRTASCHVSDNCSSITYKTSKKKCKEIA